MQRHIFNFIKRYKLLVIEMKFSEKLGEGRVIKTNIGETIFKLYSYEKNPIIKPKNLGLTWSENSEVKIGAVFNWRQER